MRQVSYYIASGLGNAEQVKAVKAKLDAAGWRHTYDWTVHGSVQSEGKERLHEVSSAESVGVWEADVLIVLLPGGRGTHSELGMQIGKLDTFVWLWTQGHLPENPVDSTRICIFSPDASAFNPSDGTTCAFYFHPYVERFVGDLDTMIDIMIGGVA